MSPISKLIAIQANVWREPVNFRDYRDQNLSFDAPCQVDGSASYHDPTQIFAAPMDRREDTGRRSHRARGANKSSDQGTIDGDSSGPILAGGIGGASKGRSRC
jgi:hypothetical protein